MANRILRLDTSAQNLQQLARFLHKKINIVRNDNTVLLAELLQISGTSLRVQNMRRQELTVSFTDIYEIIIDHKS